VGPSERKIRRQKADDHRASYFGDRQPEISGGAESRRVLSDRIRKQAKQLRHYFLYAVGQWLELGVLRQKVSLILERALKKRPLLLLFYD